MRIEVKLFAGLAQRAGARHLSLDLPAGATVAEALAALSARFPGLEVPANLMLAVNLAYVPATTPLREGDVLALIPPVSGG